jgi:hypothetical protein
MLYTADALVTSSEYMSLSNPVSTKRVNIIHPTHTLLQREIAKRHLQNANTTQRPQTQDDFQVKNDHAMFSLNK